MGFPRTSMAQLEMLHPICLVSPTSKTLASKTKAKYYFQNVKALFSSIMPAEQASELIPAYQ